MINKELELIQNELFKGFTDPLPNNAIVNFISSGSKFIRSVLPIYYLKSQNCEITQEISKILAAGEIIHNASLLHDDVIDKADIRREKATLAKIFTPEISILSGDYLLAEATKKILETNQAEILYLFLDCTKKMTEAELKQHFLKGKIPTQEEYLSICKGKTASLFATILESCALISGLDKIVAHNFAESFGICFQIKNDLELKSSLEDKNNQIHTAKDVLGIEKTNLLLDNYKKEMKSFIKDFPENNYKKELEDLINSL